MRVRGAQLLLDSPGLVVSYQDGVKPSRAAVLHAFSVSNKWSITRQKLPRATVPEQP